MSNIEIKFILTIAAIFFLRILGISMVLPVLSIYGMKFHGATEFLIGISIGIYGLLQAIFQIPMGIVSDYFGRKLTIITGLLIFSIGSIIAAITNNIWGIIVGRAIQGIGAISSSTLALLSDLIKKENYTRAISIVGMIIGIAFSISIILGPIITSLIGIRGLFLVITILSIISIILTISIFPNTNNQQYVVNFEKKTINHNFDQIITNTRLLKINISIFCLHSILALNFSVIPQIIVNAGLSVNKQWKLYLISILLSFFITMPIIIYLEYKKRTKDIFLTFLIILLLSEFFLLINTNNYLPIVYTGIQMFFIAFNAIESTLPSLINKFSPKNRKGTAMGIYSTSQFLGIAFGGILSGIILQFFGNQTIFLLEIIITLLLSLINIVLYDFNNH